MIRDYHNISSKPFHYYVNKCHILHSVNSAKYISKYDHLRPLLIDYDQYHKFTLGSTLEEVEQFNQKYKYRLVSQDDLEQEEYAFLSIIEFVNRKYDNGELFYRFNELLGDIDSSYKLKKVNWKDFLLRVQEP